MTDYIVRFTDTATTPITVPEDTVDRDSVGVVLVGRVFKNYGQDINEDVLNLLENFACPESSFTTDMYDAEPDLTLTSKNQLSNPIHGQFWYNSTRELIYFYDNTKWVPIPPRGSYAANWGQVIDGVQLPRPVNAQGYIFPYDECIWSVAPANINGTVDMLNCNTDAVALVTMEYRYANTETIVPGIANYLIIGITGNQNGGSIVPPIEPSSTPGVTVTPTPAITSSTTPTPTPTITATLTPTPTPTG